MADSKGQDAAWHKRQQPPGTTDRLSLRWLKWTPAYGFDIDDSTTNVVLVININIIQEGISRQQRLEPIIYLSLSS